MSNLPLAVVTGAYRGIGLATCRALAERGYAVVLTARREAPGREAAEALRRAGHAAIHFQPLDVTDGASIERLARFIEETFGRLDCLVNNAGIFPDPDPASEAASIFAADAEALRTGFETNTIAPLRLCQALIPLMRGEGRVVNVSSGMGQLQEMNGRCPGYRLSKTALNAVTRIFADELRGTGVKVNSVCPGWVRTEMGGAEAPRSPEEGARGIVWAATLPADGPSGGLFRDGEPISW